MVKYDKFGNARHQTVVPASKMQNAQMISNSAQHMKHYYNQNDELKTGHS